MSLMVQPYHSQRIILAVLFSALIHGGLMQLLSALSAPSSSGQISPAYYIVQKVLLSKPKPIHHAPVREAAPANGDKSATLPPASLPVKEYSPPQTTKPKKVEKKISRKVSKKTYPVISEEVKKVKGQSEVSLPVPVRPEEVARKSEKKGDELPDEPAQPVQDYRTPESWENLILKQAGEYRQTLQASSEASSDQLSLEQQQIVELEAHTLSTWSNWLESPEGQWVPKDQPVFQTVCNAVQVTDALNQEPGWECLDGNQRLLRIETKELIEAFNHYQQTVGGKAFLLLSAPNGQWFIVPLKQTYQPVAKEAEKGQEPVTSE